MPRAAVRASSRRDSRAAGERERAGVRARLSRQRDARGSGVGRRRGRSLARRDACHGGRLGYKFRGGTPPHFKGKAVARRAVAAVN